MRTNGLFEQTRRSAMKKFASVRTHYYKHVDAINVLDHAHSMRNGFTRSSNVHNEFSGDNQGVYIAGNKSCLDAYSLIREKHTSLKNKAPRCDMNTLFEHVVILSVEQYEAIENKFGAPAAKKHVLRSLRKYADEIQAEFGFKPLGFDFHLDEGEKSQDGTIKRNIHAHVMFYNYDFKNKVAPLRGLMAKGKNPETGKTNSLNQNFQKMQDLVAGSFANLGFERGISKGIDNPKHVKKANWVIKQREEGERQLKQILDQINTGVSNLEKLQNQVELGNGDLNKLQNTIEEKRSALMNITKKIHGAESKLSKQQIGLLEPITAVIHSLTTLVDFDAVHSLTKLISEYDNAKSELDLEPESLKELDNVLSPYRPRM